MHLSVPSRTGANLKRGDIIGRQRRPPPREPRETPARIDGRLNDEIGGGLFTPAAAAAGLSDSAARVLLGDGQIKDSRADRRRL